MRFVALLRGINVGKSVQVPMKTLQSLLEENGLTNVLTYLNSGNVIFESEFNSSELQIVIEKILEQKFGEKIPTLVKTSAEMINIKNSIPAEWKNDETQQTYVAYLFKEVAHPELITELPIKRQFLEIKYAQKPLFGILKEKIITEVRSRKLPIIPLMTR